MSISGRLLKNLQEPQIKPIIKAFHNAKNAVIASLRKILNHQRTCPHRLFKTMVGKGAFFLSLALKVSTSIGQGADAELTVG